MNLLTFRESTIAITDKQNIHDSVTSFHSWSVCRHVVGLLIFFHVQAHKTSNTLKAKKLQKEKGTQSYMAAYIKALAQ